MDIGKKEIQTESMINFKVTKSNDLIQKTRFSLSLQEQKIIAYIVSQVEPEDQDFTPYVFDMKNFCEICGITPRGAYKNLKETIKALADKSFWFKDEEKGEEVLLRWIGSAKLSKEKGKIIVTISPDMKPFLLALKGMFTTYSYFNIANFSSRYSIRLFEILKSYANVKSVVFDIDDFKKLMDAENYEEYKYLKKRCIQPAIEEINQYTEMDVALDEVRKGKKVIQLKFYIEEKKKKPIFVYDRDFKKLGRKHKTNAET